eukprot:6207216-Pleurochrysis_carterae.AAC.2
MHARMNASRNFEFARACGGSSTCATERLLATCAWTYTRTRAAVASLGGALPAAAPTRSAARACAFSTAAIALPTRPSQLNADAADSYDAGRLARQRVSARMRIGTHIPTVFTDRFQMLLHLFYEYLICTAEVDRSYSVNPSSGWPVFAFVWGTIRTSTDSIFVSLIDDTEAACMSAYGRLLPLDLHRIDDDSRYTSTHTVVIWQGASMKPWCVIYDAKPNTLHWRMGNKWLVTIVYNDVDNVADTRRFNT